jgi:hypothetical protein
MWKRASELLAMCFNQHPRRGIWRVILPRLGFVLLIWRKGILNLRYFLRRIRWILHVRAP